MKEETNAIGIKTTYDHDLTGNLTTIHLPSSHIITNAYDELNRLNETYVNDVLKWKYSYEGEQLSSIFQGANLFKSFTYLDNGFIESVSERGNLLEYSYSGAEYTSQLRYTIGTSTPTVIDYSVDDVYRMKEIKKNGQLIPLVSFQYDPKGMPKTVDYQNNSSISMGYDRGRLSSYTLNSSPTSELEKYSYEYDENHNIKKISSNAGITNYAYDELNQLKTEELPDGTILSYQYDAAGNRILKQKVKDGVTTPIHYVYNEANQLIKAGNQDYQYDENGNLHFDGNKSYVFNAFNQLEEIKDISGNTIASYTYDEEGKRITSNTSEGIVNYFYDGDTVLYETDENNQILREYTYNDSGQPLTMTTNGNTYYYLFNHHGDVIALTDSNGNVVASYTYDAWGNILTQSGPMASENPYRYAGYRYDENTNLYYLMARYYNPDNGVFLSIDPVRGDLENPITLNGYNYANNNPVMNVDPSGHIAQIAAGALIGALINAVGYVASLIAKYGAKNAFKHFSGWAFTKEILKGAVSGALGGGIVATLAKRAQLGPIATKFLAGHMAPAAYAVSNYKNFGRGSFSENQVLALFSDRVGFLWAAAKPYVQKIYSKYSR